MAEFDLIDAALLEALQEDSRRSLAELGKLAGLSVSATKDRIDKLSTRGVVTGFHAHLEPESIGLDLLAFVFVGWSNSAAEQAFLERLAGEPSVLECHHITGVWNYVLKVRVRNPRMLEGLLANVIKASPGVERTETIIVLSTRKETSRLPITPPAWGAKAP